jgi:hypothetical protein
MAFMFPFSEIESRSYKEFLITFSSNPILTPSNSAECNLVFHSAENTHEVIP